MRDAWERGQTLSVHGWIYGLDDGRVRDLGIDVHDMASLAERRRQAVANLANTCAVRA